MRALLLVSSPISFSSSSSSHHRFLYSSLLRFSSISISASTSSSGSVSVSVSSSSFNNPNPMLINYLIDTFEFSKPQLDSVSKYYQSGKTPKEADSVVHLLREFGFSETQIRNSVLLSPRILSFQEKTLKPKLSLFQNELGLTGSHLGRFISSNPTFLNVSLEGRLIPNISILKKFIPKNENGYIPLGSRFLWYFGTDPKKLLSNISFLQSCGIVGSQLSSLFTRQPTLFIMSEPVLRDLVCKAQEMGFSCNSKMFVHALVILSSLSSKTIEKRYKMLKSVGFSQEECSAMFRSTPGLLTVSEKKLKLRIDFFDGAGFEREMLVRNPICLMLNLEKRVIPRFRVYHILKSKQQLLNYKCPSFITFLKLHEKSFLNKFVFKFGDNAKELLEAYNNGNGNVLNCSVEQN